MKLENKLINRLRRKITLSHCIKKQFNLVWWIRIWKSLSMTSPNSLRDLCAPEGHSWENLPEALPKTAPFDVRRRFAEQYADRYLQALSSSKSEFRLGASEENVLCRARPGMRRLLRVLREDDNAQVHEVTEPWRVSNYGNIAPDKKFLYSIRSTKHFTSITFGKILLYIFQM